MITSLTGGKTGPRLLQDLSRYDPRRLPSSGFNILTDIPYHDEDRKDELPPLPQVAKNSCTHEWSLKRNQTILSDNGYKSDPSSVWVVAACCTKCRSHLELSVDCRTEEEYRVPCPNESHPVHHFHYRPRLSRPRLLGANTPSKNDGFAWVDMQAFQCSSASCCASLVIRFKAARLTQDWVDLLTDKHIIKTRAEKAIAEDPARFEGLGVPLPVDVLSNLHAYIKNALFEPEKSKTIQGHNKRFMLSLGVSCAELLQYLGFALEEDDWLPPRPDSAGDTPFTNPLNILLDDILREILILISQRPEDERRSSKVQIVVEMANKDLKGALGCTEYKQSTRSRTIDLTKTTQEHPFYAGLGAVEDFSDELIAFAYDRQIEIDLQNSPYYLECLQGIADGRNSEDLRVKVAVEASSEKISLRDIRTAFRELGLSPQLPYAEDIIIGTFNSRVTDAPKQEPELRRALKVIGQSRSSEKIQIMASQAISNYKQALSFLDANEDTPDEFIPPMVVSKLSDRPADENLARHAVQLIAHHRNSKSLKHWLDTGEIGEVEMDSAMAYGLLDITDRTIDDDIILAAYHSQVMDRPEHSGQAKKALAAIAQDRDSLTIKTFLNTDTYSSVHPLSEWPVGLENIGNTCYLNSLLQCYFTVEPLRDLVLTIDNFKTPTDATTLKSKRVGSRIVTKEEVRRAQEFVDKLRQLFTAMINSPKTSVTPEPELARLTLVSSSKAEDIRRQSIISQTRPNLGEINGIPILGPSGPTETDNIQGDVVTPGNAASQDKKLVNIDEAAIQETDTSSDDTLVDGPGVNEDEAMVLDENEEGQQDKILENKENFAPAKASMGESSPEADLYPLGDTSPSRLNKKQGLLGHAEDGGAQSSNPAKTSFESSTHLQESIQAEHASLAASPPNRSPPPVPARPYPADTLVAIKEAEFGAQQDVTEVITNVLFQLQCAIKAESVDESGEQIDIVKQLFFGKQKTFIQEKNLQLRWKEEYMSDIKIQVPDVTSDIYTALDGAYDMQWVEVGKEKLAQFAAISQAPPILQIHIQRAQFDREKNLAYKSENFLELKEKIYLDRYLESGGPDLIMKRKQSWKMKQEIRLLEETREKLLRYDFGQRLDTVLGKAAAILRADGELSKELDPNSWKAIERELIAGTVAVDQYMIAIENEKERYKSDIARLFEDLREEPYSLHSVFIHRGLATSGHYWIYIYDFIRKMWIKYNDDHVTEVEDPDEIFKEAPGTRPATPYFLVYVKDERKEDLVESICRQPIPGQQTERQDTTMEGVDPSDPRSHYPKASWPNSVASGRNW